MHTQIAARKITGKKKTQQKCVENQQQLLDIKLKLKIAVAVVQFKLLLLQQVVAVVAAVVAVVFLWQTDDERIKMQQMRHQKRLRKSEKEAGEH